MSMKNATRINLWLDHKQLAWVKKKISEYRFANVSHAIRYALQKLMDEEKEPEIIILDGHHDKK